MRWDVLFMIHRLGVLSEALREPLGNCSSRVDMLCLGEESSCPDSVTFFKRFIWEVSFQLRRQLGRWLSFIFLVGIFYESWERTSPASIYSFSVFVTYCYIITPVRDSSHSCSIHGPLHRPNSQYASSVSVTLLFPSFPIVITYPLCHCSAPLFRTFYCTRLHCISLVKYCCAPKWDGSQNIK